MTRPFFDHKAFKDSILNQIVLGRLGQLKDIRSSAEQAHKLR